MNALHSLHSLSFAFRFIPGHLDPLVIIVVGLLRCAHTHTARKKNDCKNRERGKYKYTYDTRNDLRKPRTCDLHVQH